MHCLSVSSLLHFAKFARCGTHTAVTFSSRQRRMVRAPSFFPPNSHSVMSSPAAAALVDDVVENVLLRIPPDSPEDLAPAAVVCRPWYRVASRPDFRRRFREFHRAAAAPMLGVLFSIPGAGADEASTSVRFVLTPSTVAARPSWWLWWARTRYLNSPTSTHRTRAFGVSQATYVKDSIWITCCVVNLWELCFTSRASQQPESSSTI